MDPTVRLRDGTGGTPAAKLEPVRIFLLGGFRVSVGERTVEERQWRLKKAASLVKLLALAPGHRLHREQVMETLWPDLGAKAAANNLYSTLHVARGVLEPGRAGSRYLPLEDGWIALCPHGQLWVDVDALEEAAVTARLGREPAAYRVTLDLYAGDLLPEDLYEGWAEARRRELRRLRIELLMELARRYEERGEYEPAIETLKKVAASEQTNEEAHAGLIRLYSVSGRDHLALRQYRRLENALRSEVGAKPSAESERFYREIRTGRAQGPYRPPVEPAGAHRHNLPTSRTSFVGRERELTEVKRMLAMTGLLTLTGTGGCGKTRLALEAARDLVGVYPDGVWLVELAPLSEGELVPQAVARVLGVREQPGQPLVSTLVSALSRQKALLVLDNCEHLVEAAARLVDALLSSCPGLQVLATSREPLGITGEIRLPVRPLSLPDAERPATVEELAGYESARLFVERALYRPSAFILTPENAEMVAEICRKLDGIPLAIELAAARVGALAVDRISQRLDDSLKLLTTGDRTSPPRQQTLRGALDWSYELLSRPERTLFRRLSVFAGGWTLEAAEAVGAGEGVEEADVLDLLSRLVDKSLVMAEPGREGDLRYRLLEPVRQYAREKLEGSGEAEDVRRRHAAFFIALAEEAEPWLITAEQVAWLEKLDAEHGNLRAALRWSLRHGEPETALRLGRALWRFWYLRVYLSEGRRWLEEVLALSGGAAAVRARTLDGAAHLAWCQGDFERAAVLREESLKLFRQLGDEAGIATSLTGLGSVARMRGDYAAARSLLEEALPLRRKLGDRWSIAESLFLLGGTAAFQSDHAAARPLLEEALALFREVGERQGMADSLGVLGMSALSRGDYAAAHSLFEGSQEIMRSLGDRRGLGKTFNVKGDLALNQGDYDTAHALYEDALAIFDELDDRWWLAWSLEGLAGVAAARGQSVRAARVFGATEGLRETINGPRPAAHRDDYERWLALARQGSDEATFAAAWAEGRAMSPKEAIEYALSGEEAAVPAARSSDLLTRREREVAEHVARGLTNRQVATELSISERTVHTHVRRILRKLGLGSRAQITAWVMETRSS